METSSQNLWNKPMPHKRKSKISSIDACEPRKHIPQHNKRSCNRIELFKLESKKKTFDLNAPSKAHTVRWNLKIGDKRQKRCQQSKRTHLCSYNYFLKVFCKPQTSLGICSGRFMCVGLTTFFFWYGLCKEVGIYLVCSGKQRLSIQ